MLGKTLEGNKEAVLPAGLSSGEMAGLKYSTALLCLWTWSAAFLCAKNILSDCRHSLTKENLSIIMICHCPYSQEIAE